MGEKRVRIQIDGPKKEVAALEEILKEYPMVATWSRKRKLFKENHIQSTSILNPSKIQEDKEKQISEAKRIEESNKRYRAQIRDIVEEFHEFFLSYKFGEYIKNERVASQFRHCVDMLTRACVCFMGESIDGRGGVNYAKDYADRLSKQKKFLVEIIEEEFGLERK
jgi:hypothetical protein